MNYIYECLENAGKQIPPKIECTGMKDGRFVIHGYEIVQEETVAHTATWFWYSVGRDGSIYDDVFMWPVDPKTMSRTSSDT